MALCQAPQAEDWWVVPIYIHLFTSINPSPSTLSEIEDGIRKKEEMWKEEGTVLDHLRMENK